MKNGKRLSALLLTGVIVLGVAMTFAVSRLLGHERSDVTNIYLASVRKGERHEQ